MEKMNGYGLDPKQTNVQRLLDLFPEVFADGRIDFDRLRAVLGDVVEGNEERYSFSWVGKAASIRNALTPSNGTLLAEPSKSVNFSTSENIYIEGDNLEALKLLSKTYHHKVKLIYIDPPYNTGHDFVYKDAFADSIQNYLEVSSQTTKSNPETSGRFHTDWLNMMYARLKLAKEFLTDDGAIFISIDDAEQANLKKICDEIFGEQNFITTLIWSAGRKNDSKYISVSHEYILCYVNSIDTLTANNVRWRERKRGLEDIYAEYEELCSKYGKNYARISAELKAWYKSLPEDNPAKAHAHYSLVDENGIFFADNASWPGGGGPKYEVLHPITHKPVKVPSRGWIYSTPERMQEMINAGKIYFGPDETYVPCIKSYLKDRETAAPYSVFYKDGRAATKRLRDLLGGMYFQNHKDEEIIKNIIAFTLTDGEAIVMDFFSGSGTTAHSVMQINAEDGGHRKFILVQLPELIDEREEAYAAGFRTICDIGEQRLRLTAKKIKTELEEARAKAGLLADQLPNPDDLDFGFKVFRLDSSNIIAWDGSKQYTEEEVMLFGKVIKDGRTDLDVAYEIMLKYGVFDKQLTEKQVNGKKMFSVDNDSMIICLADEITADDVMAIVKLKPSVVVFKEAGFKDDNEKMNADYTLKHYLGEGDIKVLCI